MTHDIIWDLETYPNVFTLHAVHAHLPIEWSFEISDWRNDSRAALMLDLPKGIGGVVTSSPAGSGALLFW